MLTSTATTTAANAITNVASTIASRLRRGAAKPTATVPQQPMSSMTATPYDRLSTAVTATSQPPAVPQPTSLHQPRSLRAMTNEHDNRHDKSLFNVKDINTAMKNNCVVKKITSKIPMDEHTFLTKVKLTLCDLLEPNRNMKIRLKLTCIMTRIGMATGQKHDEKATFRSETHENFPATDLNNLYKIMKEKALDAFATYLNSGSSWRFKEVESPTVHIDKNISLRGSSYKDLPKFIRDKKAVINVRNRDNVSDGAFCVHLIL
jgi:hypothetical protein